MPAGTPTTSGRDVWEQDPAHGLGAADGSWWRRCDADLAKLTLDPHVAPARVLPGESQDGLTKLRIDRRATDPDGPVGPLSPHELAVPPEQGLRRHHEGSPSSPWQQTSRRCAGPGTDGEEPRSPRPSPRRPTASQARPPRRRRSIKYRIDSTMGRGCYMPCPEGESQLWHPSRSGTP